MKSTQLLFSNEIKSDKPQDLSAIHLQEKNIAIYEREITHLKNEIEMYLKNGEEIRTVGKIEEIKIALKSALQGYNTLREDIVFLLELFQQITQTNTFRLLLAKVNTNMCRRFHTDMNDLRLLCTYYGQGTLWLPEEAIDRKALNHTEENEKIVKDEKLIQQAHAGDVAILKGAIYPKEGTKAIVHRSPTIEETNEKRVLLRIDTDEFLSFL